ncbi:MAG: hypothetical protein AABZ47_15660 [Planctomycetota bacterium]
MRRFLTHGSCLFVLWTVSVAWSATATFTPAGSTVVPAGTSVVFDVTVTVQSLGGFNTADAVIGSDGAIDVAFSYSAAFMAAFQNETTPIYDNGFYVQDVFVGGNNPTSVGTSLLLGTVTIDTTGMTVGAYLVEIDNARDGASTLGLSGVTEALVGSGGFQVTPPSGEASFDAEGSRYLAIFPGDGVDPVGYFVTPVCAGGVGKYVGAPSGPFNVARLVDNPVNAAYLTPAQWGLFVHLTGVDIVPEQAYDLQEDLGTPGNPNLQPPLTTTIWLWGDVDNTVLVDVDDLICLLNAFANILTCPIYAVDLAGEDPDQIIDVDDLIGLLGAFASEPYFGTSPCP